jgi:hypothetical protein
MNDDATLEATRERGWWRIVIAVALFLFVPMTPLLRIMLPVEQTILLLAPALAACGELPQHPSGQHGPQECQQEPASRQPSGDRAGGECRR